MRSATGTYSDGYGLPMRRLSHLLIIILVILSPLTFSNDDIPNFEPKCEAKSFTSKKADVTVTLYYPPPLTVHNDPAPSSVKFYSFPPAVFPSNLQIVIDYPSRAPPV